MRRGIPHRCRHRGADRHAAVVVICLLGALMADDAIAHELIVPSLPAPFAAAISAGPYNFEFTDADNLRLSVANCAAGVRVEVHYRVAPLRGAPVTTVQAFTPTTDRAVTTIEWSIGAGYLLNATAIVSTGTPRKGQTYVKLEAIHGRGASATILGPLLAGSPTVNQPVAWPGSPIESSLDSAGFVRTISGSDPAGNTEASETVPSGARWQLLMWAITYTTSSAPADRLVQVTFDDGATVYLTVPTPSVQQANKAWRHSFAQGLSLTTIANAPSLLQGAPFDMILPAGHRIRTATVSMQVGDDYGAPLYTVREWLEV